MIEQYLHSLTPSEKNYLARVEDGSAIWVPQSAPQWLAFLSRADELFYGGAAGGGKTDLLIGLGAECHMNSAIFRRTYKNLRGIIIRANEIIGDHAEANKSDKTWTFPNGRLIELGAMQYEDDKEDWQGRPHDFKGYDEITSLTEGQYVFTSGWNRTTIDGQRVRVVCAGNPPMSDVGSWVIKRWAAWLDDTHPSPAKPGELRWYATIDGEEVELLVGDPVTDETGETIYPKSRTFIPANLDDNPFLGNEYRSVLQALPEPLRSQLLYGDFKASVEVDAFQVIPTEWVRLAQERWEERERPDVPLSSVGLDPARGGRDNMCLSKRYDNWFDEVIAWPGSIVKDGPIGAALVQKELDGEEPDHINLDIIGIGSSVYDSLKPMYNDVRPVNAAGSSEYRDRSKKLKMRNIRAEYYWLMRDTLDPVYGDDIALPPGNDIVADLCSARYVPTTAGVKIEEKEEIKKRIGRSPDKGEAILLANYRQKVKMSGFVEVKGL